MGTIAKINGVTWTSVAKVNGIAVASIAKVNGMDKPAAGGVDWTNLVAYWPMDEASGSRVDDIGGITLAESSASVGSTSVTGKAFSTAADFEQSDDKYLSAATGAGALHTNAWTCCAWVRSEALADFAQFMSTLNSNTFAIYYRDANRVRFSCVGVDLDYSFSMTANNWYFVCFGYDNTANKQFVRINNSARTEITNNASYNTSATTLVVGKGNSAPYNWDGPIGPIYWYNTYITNADSEARLNALYNSGTGVTYP